MMGGTLRELRNESGDKGWMDTVAVGYKEGRR